MMAQTFVKIISELARREGFELAPNSLKPLGDLKSDASVTPVDLSDALTKKLNWPNPLVAQRAPEPHDFPILVFCDRDGWVLGEQWVAEGHLRVVGSEGPSTWLVGERNLTFTKVRFPQQSRQQAYGKALRLFIDVILERKRAIIEASLATVLLSVIGLATSLYTMQVYDRVVPRGGFSTLWVLTIGVLIAVGIDFLLRVVRAVMLERDSAFIDARLSSFFFNRSQSVRLDARQGGVGSMAAQLRSYDQVRSLLSSATVFAIADLPFALLFIGVIYLLAGWVAIVPAIAFLVALVMGGVFAFLIRKQSDAVQVGSHRKNGLLVESLDAAETVKSTRGEWQMLAKWNRLVDDVQESDYDLKKLSAVANAFNAALQQASYILLIALGAIEVVNGNITTGTLIAASILNGRITGTLVTQLPSLIVQGSYARSALIALNSFLELPTDRESSREYLRPTVIENEITVEGLEFAYAGASSGFNASELTIKPGERIAIVGPVGSGKSTFLKILAGLMPPQRGKVRLGGLDMGLIAEDRLRQHVGYVGQAFRLVNGTLREQLTMGISDPGDQAILEACEKTGLSNLIANHPKGMDLPIYEGGRGLSGGQRMLVGVTRMLLARPSLYLLDEPTASLDPDVEQRVWQSLIKQLAPEDTLIFVTHKFQLLNLVQRVIVVSQGRIILDGPTQAVLEKLRPEATPIVRRGLVA